MYEHMIGVDIAYTQIKRLGQAQAHAVDGEDKALEPSLPCRIDHVRDFVVGKYVGQFFLNRGLDDIDPVPLAIEDVFIEKLKSTAISLDGAPGVSL